MAASVKVHIDLEVPTDLVRLRLPTHFELGATCEILGRTAIGRATVDLLQLNRPVAIAIRNEEKSRSRWP
jgi:hypothetical protein